MNAYSHKALFERAQKVIPGGVNSPVRSFAGVGSKPVFIERAQGSLLYDTSGKSYVDYIGSWGPMIFGHAWRPLVDALKKQVEKSTSIGLATEKEVEFAELIQSMVPGADKVRLVNSGTEACMTAIRIARGVTGKQKFIKFNGCYHGHADPFLVKAGSGLLTHSQPSGIGIPEDAVKHTLVAEFNDMDSVKSLFSLHGDDIAAVIVEPVAGNMGCVPPAEGFLSGLRALTKKHNACLIFDEVMTGFRLAPGGAQELYGVEADIITFGKIIGGGLPVGAVAGKNKWMDSLAPLGQVYQAGTLSGNPMATTAGLTVLSELKQNDGVYKMLDGTGNRLENGLHDVFAEFDWPVRINRVGSMISLFFTDEDVTSISSVEKADMCLFSEFFNAMLQHGVHLPPSGFESWFIAASHKHDLIDRTLSATQSSLQTIQKKKRIYG